MSTTKPPRPRRPTITTPIPTTTKRKPGEIPHPPGTGIQSPKFSISPIHALALSNIYHPLCPHLFTSRTPRWTTSPLPLATCIERKKRHLPRNPHPTRYKSEREVNMGDRGYSTDPRGLRPDVRMQWGEVVEIGDWVLLTFPLRRVRLAQCHPSVDSKRLHPQFGDLGLEGCVKRDKAGPSLSVPEQKRARGRLQILGAGLVQEIGVVFYNSKAEKKDFPTPFRELPDRKFLAFLTRNLGLVGVEAWRAEMLARDVLERRRRKEEEEEARKKRGNADVVEEEGDIREIMKEMGKKIAAAKKGRKREKRRRNTPRVFRSLERSIKRPIRSMQTAFLKGCLLVV